MNLRFSIIFAMLLGAGQVFGAGGDPRAAQVDAAAADAVVRLRGEIEAQYLSPNLNVAEFLRRTGGADSLVQTLRRADQIGGPRWIDNDTCQVKLAISSERVRQALVKVAQDSGKLSPLPAEALAAKLRVWDNRTFTATGTSISAARAQMLRPPDPGPWRTVPDEARKQTIINARNVAVERVLDSLRPVEIAEGTSLSTVLANAEIAASLRQWLAGRPVTRVEFHNDLSVEITLSAAPRDVFDALNEIASKPEALPKDSLKLAKIRSAFEHQMSPAIGGARVAGEVKPAVLALQRIPRKAPAWVEQPISIELSAPAQGTRLKTARAAGELGRDLLRKRVDALELAGTTIGEAAKRDAAVEAVVQQVVNRACAQKTEYLPDGSAKVILTFDPRDLWDELSELP